MADDDYLKEGWNPMSVTVPRLRCILVAHDIDFPSDAKKAALVQLVRDKVMPQIPQMRAEKATVKRSSVGIVNAGSAEDVADWADHDLVPSAKHRRSGVSKKKSSARIAPPQ